MQRQHELETRTLPHHPRHDAGAPPVAATVEGRDVRHHHVEERVE